MSSLFMIFDKESIDEGNKVFRDTSKVYERIDLIINSEELPRHGFGFYYFYPYLFKDEFNGLGNDCLNKIAQSGIFCLENLLYIDRMIDNQSEFSINNIFQKNFLMNYATKILSTYFTYSSEFWIYFERYYQEYILAVTTEVKNHFNRLSTFEYNEFSMIARGKSALAKYPPTALAFLSDRKDRIPDFEKSLDIFAEAFQLYDDLRDWKEDFELKHFTWILTKVFSENDLTIDSEKEEVSKVFFGGKYDIWILHRINKLCERAMLCKVHSRSWIRYIRYFQAKANKLMFDLYSLRKEKITNSIFYYDENDNTRDNIVLSQVNIENVIKNSLKCLFEQQKNNYAELTHWMMYLKDTSEKKEECIEGNIFWRSFTLNLLYELNDFGYKVPEGLINEDIQYLINKKSIYHTYGWSYCNYVKELPPDLDTLSEMTRLSARYEDEVLKNGVRESISKAIDFINNEDGSFGTYIIDKYDDSDSKAKALKAVLEVYGTDASPEVNANFMYALLTLDLDNYRQIIEKGLHWLMNQQTEEGYWNSSYYLGNYYCGYILAKINKSLRTINDFMDKNIRYILTSQNLNGSWGSSCGNPLDTAFAISSIIDYNDDKAESNRAVRGGMKYLLTTMDENYYWTGCEFLAFGKGRYDSGHQMMRYRSSILTSMICIYALAKGKIYSNDIEEGFS